MFKYCNAKMFGNAPKSAMFIQILILFLSAITETPNIAVL